MDTSFVVQGGPETALIAAPIMLLLIGLVVLTVAAIKVVIFCKIFAKTGYGWALGLLMLVPIADIIMAFVLAFGDWPVCRELRVLKQQRPAMAPHS